MPPLYIFKTKSKISDNYRIDPEVCEGLPVVSGKYGGDTTRQFTSEVSVRKKGSTDTPLWSGYNRTNVLIPYAGKISPTPVRDPVTKKLTTGPLIEKTGTGPGRLSSEGASIEFREAFQAMGVHILLSLPNGTECTAELDQIYSQFKP